MDNSRIESIFKSHPSVEEFHFTKDGQGFEHKHHAEAHAKTLDKENPYVGTLQRGDAIAETEKPADIKQVEIKRPIEKPVIKKIAVKKPDSKK